MGVRNISIIFCCLILLIVQKAYTQEVSEEDFQEIVKELNYDKTKRALRLRDKFKLEPVKEEKEPPAFSFLSKMVLELCAYVMIVILLIFILYLIFSNIKTDKKISQSEEELGEIEDIEEIDATALYNSAIVAGDYRLAIRMQFIKALQVLSEKDLIQWEIEKTNRDYYREISEADLKKSFRELANIYERVWYGEQDNHKYHSDFIVVSVYLF